MKKYKNYLLLFALGCIALGLLFVFFKTQGLNIPRGLLLLSGLLVTASYFTKNYKVPLWAKTFLLTLPSELFFLAFVIDNPTNWPILLYLPLITYAASIKKPHNYIKNGVLILFIIFFCKSILPNLIYKALVVENPPKKLEFVLDDVFNNTTVTEKTYKKLTFLSFFNTWCQPCKKEYPEVIELYNTFKNHPIRFAMVCPGALDEKDKVKEFCVSNKIPLPLWYDKESSFSNKYHINAVPTTVLLDQNGNVLYMQTGYAEDINLKDRWSEIIEKHLNENP